jgi:hypothetical protein
MPYRNLLLVKISPQMNRLNVSTGKNLHGKSGRLSSSLLWIFERERGSLFARQSDRFALDSRRHTACTVYIKHLAPTGTTCIVS